MRASVLFNEAAPWPGPTGYGPTSPCPAWASRASAFSTNSLNTYILSALGLPPHRQSLSAFLDERIFRPLGIGDYAWEKSPEGIEKGGWGLYISPENLAKLGLLVQQEGVWEGRRLLSADFLRRATPGPRQPAAGTGRL